jgi:hypothetical protein
MLTLPARFCLSRAPLPSRLADHFVHRFTHRVARGLLIAVGRPDGRLYCMAKTEASLLLSCKQAYFIQNPRYSQRVGSGNAPEILSIGHNPSVSVASSHITLPSARRAKFIDEELYRRIVLQKGSRTTKDVLKAIVMQASRLPNRKLSTPMLTLEQPVDYRISMDSMTSGLSATPRSGTDARNYRVPYGAQFVHMSHEQLSNWQSDLLAKSRLKMAVAARGGKAPIESNEPHDRLAFADKLDQLTQDVRAPIAACPAAAPAAADARDAPPSARSLSKRLSLSPWVHVSALARARVRVPRPGSPPTDNTICAIPAHARHPLYRSPVVRRSSTARSTCSASTSAVLPRSSATSLFASPSTRWPPPRARPGSGAPGTLRAPSECRTSPPCARSPPRARQST